MEKFKTLLLNKKIKVILCVLFLTITCLTLYRNFIYPKIAEKIFFVAETFATLEKYESGIKELNKAVLLNPFDSKIYFKKANAYALIKNDKKAFSNYNLAIFLDRKNPEYYANRSLLFAETFDFARAEFDIDKAIKLAPTNPIYYGMKATLYMPKDTKKAMELLSMAIKIDDKFEFAYITRGKLKLSQNDINGAINDFNIAININPNNADNFATRSSAHLMQQNPQAIVDSNKAVSLAPENPNMYFNRALVAYGFYNLKSAKKDFDYAKELSLQQGNYELYEKISNTANKFGL